MAHKQLLAVVAAILVVTGTVAGSAATVVADESPTPEPGDPEPPSVPASYYGNVTIDGEPAPVGTTIEAVVDGNVSGSIKINESGQYGGPSNLDPKLSVQAPDNSSNDTVRFFVNNDEIERTEVTNTDPATVEWESNDVRQVDLSAAVDEPLLRVDITDAPDNVTAGNNVPVTLNITNTGVNDADNRTVNVSIDGEVRRNITETLAVGRSTEPTAQVPTTADEAGNVTVTVDTGDRTASTTVEVVPPAQFAVTDLSLDDTAVNATEFVNGSATVENVGNRTDTQNLTVRIGASDTEVDDREVVNDTRLELDGGEARTIDFAFETDDGDVGTRIVRAATDDDANSSTVEVAAQPTFAVNVIESESNLDVVAGENASIVAEVENTGDLSGAQTVTVTREDTDTQRSVDRTLAPGDIAGIDAQFPTSGGGEFTLTVSTPDDSETEVVNVTDVGAPSFDVTIDDIDDSVDEPLAGNTTNVSIGVNVTNLGGTEGTQTIEFNVSGQLEETREVDDLSSGDSTELTDVRLPVDPGQTPSVDVVVASENDTATRTVDVNTTAEFDVTVVERSNVSVSALTTDDAFAPTIDVTNTGEQTGNATLRVRFNGSVAKNFSVDGLAAGTTREVVNKSNIALNASTDGIKIIEAEAVNNATDATDDVATRQVGVGAAPNFTVEPISLDPSGPIAENTELTIDARINNTGDDVGTNETVTIDFGDRQVGATVIEELDAGNTITVTATVSTRPEDIGTRTITASTGDDSATDTIDVQADAAFVVTNVDASEPVIAGENASVDVTVRNDGGLADNSRDVRLLAGGEAVATRSDVTLSAGETRVLTFDGSEGVATADAGTLEVTAATETDAGTDTISVGEPGELDLEVVSLTDPVTNDSTFSASVRATNVGDGRVSETIALRFEDPNGNTPQVDSTTETIDGGNSTIVSLETTLDRSLDSESTTASVAIDAASDSISETVTIEQPAEAPDFRVSNLNAPASVLDVERTVNVTATVTNVGGRDGTQDVSLTVADEVRDTNASLQLDGGASASVDLAFNASNVSLGTADSTEVDYSIDSTNQSAGNTLTVEAADPGVAEVVSTTVLTRPAVQEQSLQVEATVENTGDLNATGETVTLEYLNASGVTDTNSTGVLEPGETTTVTLEVTPPSEPRAGVFDRAVEVRSNATTVTRTVPVDFEGIRSGIAEADAEETVEIAEGAFEPRTEIVVDTPGIELAAADPTARPTIESPRQSDTIVTVDADDVGLSDLRIDGDGTGPGVVLDANNTTVRSVRIRNTSTGIDEADGTNRISRATVVDAGRGITLAGDGDTTVEFSRVADADSQGIAVASSNNTLRSVEVSDATTGIDVDGAADNRVADSAFGGNDVGVRMANIRASDTNPGARVDNSALDSNGVGALIDNTTVNSSGNWWGTPSPRENEEYLVRSGLNTDPATSRPDSQFDVSIGLADETDQARGEPVTVPITVTNDGTRLDLQTIELLADGAVVDSTTVELGADASETVELSYTPTVADGNAIEFTARSLDDTTGPTSVDIPPTDFTVSASVPGSITEGNTLIVSPTIENDGGVGDTQDVRLLVDGVAVDSESVTLGGLSAPQSVTLSDAPTASAGDTLNVRVETDDDSVSGAVSVNAPESDDTPDAPGGGGGGDDDEPADVPVPVEEVGDPTNVESVAPEVDADAGQAVATFETAESVESVALDTTEAVGDVTVSDLDPETADVEPAPGRAVALQDISVPGGAEDTAATIRFRVSADRLDVAGTTAENLRAFRLNDGEWQALETSVAEETDAGVVLEADTPGFSVFAVSAVTPPEGSIALDPGTATVGEAVTLSGTESSDPDGEIVAYEWSVDGETVTGETAAVTLEEPGEYTVELVVTDDAGETDTATATLVIEADDATATPEPESDADTPAPNVESPAGPIEEPGGFDTLPVVVVAVVLLLGAGYVAYRRRER